ncbi:MAG: hypothetical protein ACMXX5_00755 [Candidatus Woesearchaeota archaeon]
MDKEKLKLALSKVKESSTKRNFNQTIDMIITFKDLDLKKPDHQMDFFMSLHHSNGRSTKICGLVGPELKDAASKELDFAIDIEKKKK